MSVETQSAVRPVPTFIEAAEAVTEMHRLYLRREPADKRLLEIHVHPHLGSMRVSDVEPSHVVEVLKAVRRRIPKSVPRVRLCIARVLKWAVARGFRADNPCDDVLCRRLDGGVVRPEPYAALPHAEVADALAAVRGAADWIGAKLQFEFMVLAAARPGHARPARWAEIDVERRTWTLPAERTAFPFAHRVPLSSEALAVVREARDEPELQTARRRGGDFDLVFPSPRGRRLVPALGRRSDGAHRGGRRPVPAGNGRPGPQGPALDRRGSRRLRRPAAAGISPA